MTSIKVYVVNTCIPDSCDPCMPSVFATKQAAEAYLDEMLRGEWDANKPEHPETCEPLSYPGPYDAIETLSEQLGSEWGKWEITSHTIELP